MSAVATLISSSGVFSLSDEVVLAHAGGAESFTRAILSELATTPSQWTASFSNSGWTAWTLIDPKLRPVEFLTKTETGRRWRVLFQEDRTSSARDLTGKRTNFLHLVDA